MYLASCTLGYDQSPYRSNKRTHMNCLFDCGCITQGLAFLIHQPNDTSAGVYVYTYIHLLYTIILILSIIIILHALTTVNQSVQHHYILHSHFIMQHKLISPKKRITLQLMPVAVQCHTQQAYSKSTNILTCNCYSIIPESHLSASLSLQEAAGCPVSKSALQMKEGAEMLHSMAYTYICTCIDITYRNSINPHCHQQNGQDQGNGCENVALVVLPNDELE